MGDADLDLALRAILFGAVGTAGQRCTSIRRLLVQKAVAAKMVELLRGAYRQVRIGDPMDPASLMGPLITEKVVEEMMDALDKIRAQGGELVCGGKRLHGNFVEPTIVRSPPGMPMMQEEVFAPLLHVVEFETLDEAIALNNGVPQGLSSAIFTKDLRNSEAFLSARGSDCGIANVNIGTSGAEIGGAFGGFRCLEGLHEAADGYNKLFD